MLVSLIDIDSRIPNLALKKIERYHLDCGDTVWWNLGALISHGADRVYVSCIFTENRDKCWEYEELGLIGGSGYDLSVTLPPEIECIKPRINLGFTTRGCIRKCEFCVVPEKEGWIRAVGDLLDLWDGRSKDVVVMDNNILALPEHFSLICGQAREHKIRIDFNQGLDHRLLTGDMVRDMATIRHKEYRFSYDRVGYESGVRRTIGLLAEHGIKYSFWYVLVGFDTTFREDLHRLNILRGLRATAFVQRYTKNRGNLLLGKWVNRHALFRALTFEQFLEQDVNAKYYLKYREEIDEYFNK